MVLSSRCPFVSAPRRSLLWLAIRSKQLQQRFSFSQTRLGRIGSIVISITGDARPLGHFWPTLTPLDRTALALRAQEATACAFASRVELQMSSLALEPF